jgi:hypothetical protein
MRSRTRKLVVGLSPVVGSLIVGGTAPAVAAQLGPSTPSASGISGAAPAPQCTSNYQVVESAAVTHNGIQYGTADLYYDGCTRNVKAAVYGAVQPSEYNQAEVRNTDGSTAIYCRYYAGTSCVTGPVNDAGVTHKAVGIIVLGVSGDAVGITPFY